MARREQSGKRSRLRLRSRSRNAVSLRASGVKSTKFEVGGILSLGERVRVECCIEKDIFTQHLFRDSACTGLRRRRHGLLKSRRDDRSSPTVLTVGCGITWNKSRQGRKNRTRANPGRRSLAQNGGACNSAGQREEKPRRNGLLSFSFAPPGLVPQARDWGAGNPPLKRWAIFGRP